jgi:endonuclease-3
LQESFFDWNEVRVTTVTELMEHLSKLPDPKTAAMRLKKNLQSIFEVRYSFDLEDLIKMNQGKAVAELEKLGGMTPFVLAYVTQSALGGHSIPVSGNMIKVLLILEIVSPTEAEKHQTPGLERTISKAKGADFGSCLHQLGLLVAGAPEPKKPSKADEKAAAAKKEVSSKPTGKASAPSKVDATTKTAPTKTAAGKSAASAKATAPSKDQDDKAKAIPAAKAPAPKKAAPPKSANPPKAASKGKADSGAAKKPVAKKPASSKPAAKSAPPNRKPR